MVRPKLLLDLAYSSLPMRASVPFEQPDDGGEDFCPRQTGLADVLFDARPDGGEHAAEDQHLRIFRLVPRLSPFRMVAVLLAAAGVAADGLQVAVAVGADPDILVGGRDRELADAGDFLLVGDFRAVRLEELEAFLGLAAGYARFGVGHVT